MTPEEEFEKYMGSEPLGDSGLITKAEWHTAKAVYLEAAETFTKRTAQRCVEICHKEPMLNGILPSAEDCARAIKEKFGLPNA